MYVFSPCLNIFHAWPKLNKTNIKKIFFFLLPIPSSPPFIFSSPLPFSHYPFPFSFILFVLLNSDEWFVRLLLLLLCCLHWIIFYFKNNKTFTLSLSFSLLRVHTKLFFFLLRIGDQKFFFKYKNLFDSQFVSLWNCKLNLFFLKQ